MKRCRDCIHFSYDGRGKRYGSCQVKRCESDLIKMRIGSNRACIKLFKEVQNEGKEERKQERED